MQANAVSEYLEVYTGRNGNNDQWFRSLLRKLRYNGCFGITEEEYQVPPSDSATVHGVARHENHVRKNEKFLAIVEEACGFELYENIIGDTTDPKVILARLKEFRDNTRETNPMVIRHKLYSFSMGGLTAQAFVNGVMALRRDIQRCGGEVKDHEVMTILLNGIPHQQSTDDFHNLYSRIKKEMVTDREAVTLPYVVTEILSRDAEVQSAKEMEGENHSPAAMTMHRGNRPARAHDPLNCWHCGEPRHNRYQCKKFYDFLTQQLERTKVMLSKMDIQDDNAIESPSNATNASLLTDPTFIIDEEKGDFHDHDATIDEEKEMFHDASETTWEEDIEAAVINSALAQIDDLEHQGW